MKWTDFLYEFAYFGIEFLKSYLFVILMFQQRAKPLKYTIPIAAAAHLLCAVLVLVCGLDRGITIWIVISVCFYLIADMKLAKRLALFAHPVISVLDMTALLPFMVFFGFSMNDLNANPQFTLFANMLSIPVLLLVGLIFRIVMNKRKHIQIRGKLILPVILILVALGALETLAFQFMTAFSFGYRIFVLLTLVTANILSLLLCAMVMRSDSNNLALTQESRVMQQQMELQKQYYMRVMEKSEELRSFRHDIRNHLYCMRVLLNEGKLDELKNYMDSLDGMVHAVGSGVQSGNKLLDAILGELVSKFSDVHLELNGVYPEQSSLSDVDFCTIFFNALSNAFEAAAKTEDKKVTVSVRTMESHLLFTAANSANAAPQMKHNRYVSTKDESGHGYGMSNMIECLLKNEVQYDTEFQDGVYTLNMYFMNALAPFTAKN